MPMDLTPSWAHQEHWIQQGEGFLVTVTRREEISDGRDARGPHRWSVTATLYPAHPHFTAFQGDDFQQEAALALPLYHDGLGPSFLYTACDAKGLSSSIQVGTEYLDEGYTRHALQEDASLIFHDAVQLFQWLQDRGRLPNKG